MDADTPVRVQAAQAMGQLADPVFLPARMTVPNDKPDAQAATLASLTRVAGRDITIRADGKPTSNQEKARVWELWYRDQQDATARR